MHMKAYTETQSGYEVEGGVVAEAEVGTRGPEPALHRSVGEYNLESLILHRSHASLSSSRSRLRIARG